MPDPTFPHLRLVSIEKDRARYGAAHFSDDRIKSNRTNFQAHGRKLLKSIQRITLSAKKIGEEREELGLPPIPGGTSFLLEVPVGQEALLDFLAHKLGLELVAEYPEGFVLVASDDLEQTKLIALARAFAHNTRGSANAASILEIYDPVHSDERVRKILDDELWARWPFPDDEMFTLDVSIQTAGTLAEFADNAPTQRKHERDEDFAERQREWEEGLRELYPEWRERKAARRREVRAFLAPYQPQFVDEGGDAGLPDSITMRIQMNGQGFGDLVRNLPHIFEVTLPDEARSTPAQLTIPGEPHPFRLGSPTSNAPAVCVIDSGIMEGHQLLRPAIDAPTSRCFIPGRPADDVGDCVSNGGHGTRVAGAVLYPREIPTSGAVRAICWIQNARILERDIDGSGVLPEVVHPAAELPRIVTHFLTGPRRTRIYNHSIGVNHPCRIRRMSEWAATLDFLSHSDEILFLQSAGNLASDLGTSGNPCITDHLAGGRTHPDYLLENSSRISSPAQSLQAITVGSIAPGFFDRDNRRSLAPAHWPSAFTRTGLGMWGSVKPDVVEYGGDFVRIAGKPPVLTVEGEAAPELVCAAPHSATGRDQVGTSFAAPKVAHLAAQLQRQFPDEPALLYRALIAQSARWPEWAESESPDKVLRMIGYGLPDLERATTNTPYRVTLITKGLQELGANEAAIFAVDVPDELRNVGEDHLLRIDVTLSYSAEPRRTRSSRKGYLAVWLDWISSNSDETLDDFRHRALKTERESQQAKGEAVPWSLAQRSNQGEIRGENILRNHGTLQKDWALVRGWQLPETLAIAVRGHKGWAARDPAARARYALAVSIEAINREIEIYVPIQNQVRVRVPRITT